MEKQGKVISRKEMTDEQYIFELETMLEEMSYQAEVMFDAIDITVNALMDIGEYCANNPAWINKLDMSSDIIRKIEVVRCKLNREPPSDEISH